MTTYTFNYSVLSVVDPAGPRDDTYASGINNLGQIVGTYLGSGPQRQGFVYNNGAYTTSTIPRPSVLTAPPRRESTIQARS